MDEQKSRTRWAVKPFDVLREVETAKVGDRFRLSVDVKVESVLVRGDGKPPIVRCVAISADEVSQ